MSIQLMTRVVKHAHTQAPRPELPGPTPHRFWLKSDGLWQCLDCLRVKRQPDSALDLQPCGVLTLAMRRLAEQASGHALSACVVGRGPRLLVFCARRGSYAEKVVSRGLAAPCVGVASRERRKALQRLERGLHPGTRERTLLVGPAWPLAEALSEPGN